MWSPDHPMPGQTLMVHLESYTLDRHYTLNTDQVHQAKSLIFQLAASRSKCAALTH